MSEMEDTIDSSESLEDLLKHGGDPSKMPSTKEILKMLDTSNIPEELRENMRIMLTGNTPQVFSGYGSILAVAFVFLIFTIILFFGYKLYKSIKDKEVKREEKKKAKQLKKKK